MKIFNRRVFLQGLVHTTLRIFENASSAFRQRYAQEILKNKNHLLSF